jgi:hypothetical protein
MFFLYPRLELLVAFFFTTWMAVPNFLDGRLVVPENPGDGSWEFMGGY